MVLYGIVIGGVFPLQLVSVTDDEQLAKNAVDYLNKNVANEAWVEKVDAFWPKGFVEADNAWLTFYDKFIKSR